MCILFVYTFLKVVSYYDLNVLSMSMRGFQKRLGGCEWEGYALSSFILDFWNFFIFAKPLSVSHTKESFIYYIKLLLLLWQHNFYLAYLILRGETI